MEKKLGWLAQRFCLLCAAVFCGLILLQSVKKAADGIFAVVALAGILCAALVLWIGTKMDSLGDKTMAAVLFMIRFALAAAVIFVVGAQPIQDFNTMYTAAQELAQGGRGYLDNIYFFNWAYQTGFVVYESLLLRLFGPGQLSLQLMNAVWLGGIGALVWLIALRLMPRRWACAVSALYALYPAPYFLAAVLTNQHISVFFFYLAVWLLLRREDLTLPRSVLAGVCISVGSVMRPVGIILILAVLCWQAVRFLLGSRKNAVIAAAAVLAAYQLTFSLCSAGIVRSGINPEGLENNQPMWKFVLGLNTLSDGAWNEEDYENYLLLPTQQAGPAMEQAVRERLRTPPAELAALAVRKSDVMWGDNEYMYWGFGHLNAQEKIGPLTVDQYTQVLAYGDKGVYIVAFALALAGVLGLLRRRTQGGGEVLLSFLLCGYYGVHLIIEVQSRYRYFLLPTVFLLGGLGLSALFERRETRAVLDKQADEE